jgi:quercetin dioxygenase-like cupin family protein
MHNVKPPEIDELNSLLLDQITPLPMIAARQSAMRQGLMSRVAGNLAKQAGFLTVRAKHGAWQALKPGIRVKQLWQGRQGSSVLIEFAPGASLMPHRHNWLEEGIVLSGELQMAELHLGPLDYHVSPPGSRHAPISSKHGALAYLRGTSIGDNANILLEVIGGMLPFGKDNSRSVFAHEQEAWLPVAAGVEKKILGTADERTSAFYRFAAGGRLLGQSHGLEQEYMLLAGDAFMDDTLLRAGDYRLAPAGSRHEEIFSDVGAVIFMRGAGED